MDDIVRNKAVFKSGVGAVPTSDLIRYWIIALTAYVVRVWAGVMFPERYVIVSKNHRHLFVCIS